MSTFESKGVGLENIWRDSPLAVCWTGRSAQRRMTGLTPAPERRPAGAEVAIVDAGVAMVAAGVAIGAAAGSRLLNLKR